MAQVPATMPPFMPPPFMHPAITDEQHTPASYVAYAAPPPGPEPPTGGNTEDQQHVPPPASENDHTAASVSQDPIPTLDHLLAPPSSSSINNSAKKWSGKDDVRSHRACSACRRDKTKCDGRRPCELCRKKKYPVEECNDGCALCRKELMRCVGGRPCTICVQRNLVCVWEDGARARSGPKLMRSSNVLDFKNMSPTDQEQQQQQMQRVMYSTLQPPPPPHQDAAAALAMDPNQSLMALYLDPAFGHPLPPPDHQIPMVASSSSGGTGPSGERAKIACVSCRRDNKKCSPTLPCARCVARQTECIASPHAARSRLKLRCRACRRDNKRCGEERPCGYCVEVGEMCEEGERKRAGGPGGRVKRACAACRRDKVQCGVDRPCARCAKKGIPCVERIIPEEVDENEVAQHQLELEQQQQQAQLEQQQQQLIQHPHSHPHSHHPPPQPPPPPPEGYPHPPPGMQPDHNVPIQFNVVDPSLQVPPHMSIPQHHHLHSLAMQQQLEPAEQYMGRVSSVRFEEGQAAVQAGGV